MNDIGIEGIEHLANAFENNMVKLIYTFSISFPFFNFFLTQTLITLDLSWNNIGIEGAKHLARIFQNNKVNSLSLRFF